ncbi:MAG: hypothetical protein AAF290_16225 [Pseudomonadota bacterium]
MRYLPIRKLIATVFAVGMTARAVPDSPLAPVTDQRWREAVVSVTDLDRSAQFFKEIGGYVEHWRGELSPSALKSWNLPVDGAATAMVLGPADTSTGLIRLIRFETDTPTQPTRPGAHAWDTGCYFSLMVRMKNMQAIYDDAIALGWWTETPITYLEFGQSKLNVMVFKGPDGVQVQGYERLSPALPAAVGEFDRMTRPFNIMQMVRDRDTSYAFFRDVLGFATFYAGPPYLAPKPTPNPIAIPTNLTTTVSYSAGIVYPQPGEFGRMEMISIDGIDGYDFAERCNAPNLGILAVRFPVDSLGDARAIIERRGGNIEGVDVTATLGDIGTVNLFNIKTPDGANIQFYESVDE